MDAQWICKYVAIFLLLFVIVMTSFIVLANIWMRLFSPLFELVIHFTFLLHYLLGTHLSPVEFHQAMLDPNTVVIDVRNFNETVIGKFAPAAVALEAGETNGEL